MAPLPRLAPRLPPARRTEAPSGGRSYVKGALWSLLYVAFSTAIILSNKQIITETNFACPIAVSSLGSVFGWVASVAAVGSGAVRLKTRLTFYQWCAHVLPIGVCTAVSLAFANLAYVYLDLSFIQMVKAFAPVVTFATLVAFRLDRYDVNVALTLAVIVAGCFTASFQRMEATSVRVGLACMFACEVAEAFRSAGMQYLLSGAGEAKAKDEKERADDTSHAKTTTHTTTGKVSFSLFDGMYYFSPATLVFLAILTYVFEWDDVTDPEHLAAARRNPAPFLAASCRAVYPELSTASMFAPFASSSSAQRTEQAAARERHKAYVESDVQHKMEREAAKRREEIVEIEGKMATAEPEELAKLAEEMAEYERQVASLAKKIEEAASNAAARAGA